MLVSRKIVYGWKNDWTPGTPKQVFTSSVFPHHNDLAMAPPPEEPLSHSTSYYHPSKIGIQISNNMRNLNIDSLIPYSPETKMHDAKAMRNFKDNLRRLNYNIFDINYTMHEQWLRAAPVPSRLAHPTWMLTWKHCHVLACLWAPCFSERHLTLGRRSRFDNPPGCGCGGGLLSWYTICVEHTPLMNRQNRCYRWKPACRLGESCELRLLTLHAAPIPPRARNCTES